MQEPPTSHKQVLKYLNLAICGTFLCTNWLPSSPTKYIQSKHISMKGIEMPQRVIHVWHNIKRKETWPHFYPEDYKINFRANIDVFRSPHSVFAYLLENAPFKIDILLNVEEKINSFITILEPYVSNILTDESRPSKIKKHLFYVPSEDFLEQIRNSDALKAHSSRKPAKIKTLEESLVFNVKKNVESCSFPGFKLNEFTELAGHLDAVQMLCWIIKAQNRSFPKIWKKVFFSEASAAILQDAFWWFFLHKYKPCQYVQDKLFNRIADSFVALFMGTPRKTQDKFFLEYYDFLAQAIFAVFYKSFPESHEQFGAEFKTELVELISLWVTGLRPPHLSWMKWNLEWLVNLTIGAKKHDYDEKEEVLNMLEARAGKMSLEFNFDKLLKGLDESIVKETEIPTPKLLPTVEVKQSSYSGRGPEFQHVLYKLKGRSPLVNHYLQMRNIGSGKMGSWGSLMKRREISTFPPLHPTYEDVIKENEKFRHDLRQDYNTIHELTHKEIEKIKMDTTIIGNRISRLQRLLYVNPLDSQLKINVLKNKMEHLTVSIDENT